MITERTLRRWRGDALKLKATTEDVEKMTISVPTIQEMSERILKMTQELLDQHLLRRELKR